MKVFFWAERFFANRCCVMDVNNVDDIIASAKNAFDEGNYKGVVVLLEPLLKRKKTVSEAGMRCR